MGSGFSLFRLARGLGAVGVAALAASGCAGPASPGPSRSVGGSRESPAVATAPKRITTAILGSTRAFSDRIERAGAGSTPGSEALEEIMNAGLSVLNDRGQLQPLLAQAVPAVENGLWRVFPDGRMETRWTLKNGVRWQDGEPFTSSDLVFTLAVAGDTDIPAFRDVGFDSVERVEAPDATTVIVRWARPFIEADTLFSRLRGQPLPAHLLERAYVADKPSLVQHPYWSTEFIGLGAFKLQEFVQGSHAVLAAYDAYILGRPLIDEIEIKFIPDYNTLVANILAGTVELTLGRSLSLEQAVPVRDQWRDGRMDQGALSTWIAIYPQFINPSPAIIGNLQFRRAIYHAMDRQQMAEEFMLGLSPVAHSIIPPGDLEYPHIEARIVRYEYDLRRAAQLIEGLGYSKGADGTYRDAAGQPLVVQTQTSVGNALQEKSMFAVGEYLKKIGVGVDPDVVSAQARSDRARRAARSGFEVQKQPAGVGALPRYHGNSTPLPENSFVGNNRSRYRDAGYDALVDQFYVTIPIPERMAVLGQIVHHMTDQLNVIGLIYDLDPTMVGNRLLHVTAPAALGATVGWNAHLWDIKGP